MKPESGTIPVKGRFAPSPSGRMHLGNVFTALMSWLSVRKQGGKWILRIEDLDPQRSKNEYARLIEDDLLWLGLVPDEGGLDNAGECGPYSQSERGDIYERMLCELRKSGFLYPCRCTRHDILATQAPHLSDGRVIYGGRCRPAVLPSFIDSACFENSATRLYVPDRVINFDDAVYGYQAVNLALECGDFVLRRADGAWSYQLAVVTDDALMGVTEVVRGNDLLLSAAQQIYLFELLGFKAPRYVHVPLICNKDGIRLSKRDRSLSMEELRKRYTPDEVIGSLAFYAGILDSPEPCRASDLIPLFDWRLVGKQNVVVQKL